MMCMSDLKRIQWIVLLLVTLSVLSSCTGNGGAEQQSSQNSQSEQSEQQSVQSSQGTWGNAPDFVVMDADGKAVALSSFAGKPIVVNFWATWCGYCKLEMPDFDRAYKEYPDVVFLMVNATDGVYETKEKADAYVAQEGFSFGVYYDMASTAQMAYKISGYPTTVFINAQGDVVAKEVGAISYDTLVQGIGLISE